jgi:hypothetical protein
MAFLDFLRPKGGKAKPPDAQRADIDAALLKIAEDRAAAQLVLDGLETGFAVLILPRMFVTAHIDGSRRCACRRGPNGR